MASSTQPQTINLTDLDIAQLSEVKRQLEEELNHLTNSFARLKQAQAKFKSCIDNVGELKPQNADKIVLVPLTNSLYVPGKLPDPEHVIVDIGTGYFVKKTRPEAIKYYQAKVEYVRTTVETLQDGIQKKQDNMSSVVNVLQAKIQAETGSASKRT